MRNAISLKHPEMQQDEVLITNISRSEEWRDPTGKTEWESIDLKTKRRGEIAYDVKGHGLYESIPVFAKKNELRSMDRVISAAGEIVHPEKVRDNVMKNIENMRILLAAMSRAKNPCP
jgi:hypothetical protein